MKTQISSRSSRAIFLSENSSVSLLLSPSRLDIKSFFTWPSREPGNLKEKPMESNLLFVLNAEKNCATAMDYITCQLADKTATYDWLVSFIMVYWVEKVKPLLKTYFFVRIDLIFDVGILTTIKFACHCNHMYENVAIWVLRHFVIETIPNDYISRLHATEKPSYIVARVRAVENRSNEISRSVSEERNDFPEEIHTRLYHFIFGFCHLTVDSAALPVATAVRWRFRG